MPARFGNARSLLLGASAGALLAIATARVQEYRVRPYLEANLYLPSGKLVAQTSLGYREIAADLTWFRAVQYYGGYAKSQHDLAYFDALIEIVTDLDPHFIFPYLFGAVVMAQDMHDLERGVAVLKRGMERNPTAWELPFEIGFLHYTVARNAEQAARYFELAGRMPGGRDQARRFAAFVYSKAGHTETSIRMWEELGARDGSAVHARSGASLHRAAAEPSRCARAAPDQTRRRAMTPELGLALLAFLPGALIGSFLNVVIHRVPRGESVVGGRSMCPQCRATIAWYDNVPLASYLVLRGRCRGCRWRIPIRYPLVEFLTGAGAVGAVAFGGLTLVAPGSLRSSRS